MYDPNDLNKTDVNNSAADENRNTAYETSQQAAPDQYKTADTAYQPQPAAPVRPAAPNVNNYYSQNGNYPAQPQRPQVNSYSWSAQQNTYPQYPGAPVNRQYQSQPKPPKKKSGGKTALKILAVVMCCLLVSVSSVGVFALMIQNGVIAIEGTGGTGAAFTITKLVQDQSSSDTTNTDSGTVSALTTKEIAEKVVPSVVCIQNYQVTENYGFLGQTSTDDSDVSPVGEGSGIIYSADGYILTNAHVVDGATSLKVVTSDGSSYEAALIGSDSATDLAVVKIEAEGLTPAEFGSSEDLSVGDQVVAVGNPGGMEFNSSVTVGYVSALNREITSSETGYTMKCIQTDAAINPGNSGGALVNSYGQVIGINSSKIVASGYEGLGFAIPVDTAQPIASDLMSYGYVKDRAMLGVSGQYIDSMTSRFYGLTEGMYVGEVTSELAAQAGLQKGDVITAIDGNDITSSSTISSYLLDKKPGDTVQLTVDSYLSNTTGQTLTVTLSEYDGSAASSSDSSESQSNGR